MKAAITDKGLLELSVKGDRDPDVTITLDLFSVFESMDAESKMKVAEALTWGVVLKEAVRRLTGNAESWAGDDRDLSAEVMREIHEHAVGAPVWFWHIEKKLQDHARDLEHNESLFWRLCHDKSPAITTYANGEPIETMGDAFRLWAERAGVESNYQNHSDLFEGFKRQVFRLINSVADELAAKGGAT